MSRDLDGRVAMVTGAGGALGRAVVRTFADRGACVVGVDREGEGLLHHDIATDEGNRAAVEETVAAHGRLDILVLNAGVQHLAPLPEFPLEEWERLLGVMLTGPFLTVRHAWPQLVAHRDSRILVVASTSSFVAESYKAAYVAAKHGVLGLVKVAALEGAPHGLTANAVAPSWMRTPLVDNQVSVRATLHHTRPEDVVSELVGEHAVKRFVELDEVAATLGFLAGREASAITGTCVPVDLGALA